MSEVHAAVALACPRCGGRRLGAPPDSLLVCPRCGEATELEPSSAGRTLAVRHLAAPGGEGLVALPFYRFPALKARAAARSEEALEAVDKVNRLEAAWVVAARIKGFQAFGDVGLEYTRRPPRLEPGPPLKLLPVARRPDEAVTVLKVVLWRLLNDLAPAGSFELEPEAGPPELWCVELLFEGGHVKLPHCAVRYPASAVEGLDRLRAG